VTYWLHRNDLFSLIARMAVGGAGIRQIARSLGVSHSTVARHLTRVGRHCLLFHRSLLQDHVPNEDLDVDGFETFEFSQFFPCHYNLALGQESWFLYHFTDSPLRRKGTMTPEQAQRRAELETQFGRPDPKAVRQGIEELLRVVLAPLAPKVGERKTGGPILAPRPPLTLHTDEHKSYPPAIRSVRQELGLTPAMLRHVPTPSTDPRTRGNALFPANLADLLLRHCGADHRRETIAYDKRIQGGLERAALFTVWRNAIKWRRENHPGETAAMVAGVLTRRIGWREVLARRLFPRERSLPGRWWLYYWRRVKTAALGENQTENRARFAF